MLILFGVLDRLPAEHRARNAAVSADLDVLLLTRAQTLRSHAGQVAFPGGRVDPGDDSVESAALREAWEETGLDPSGVEVLGRLGEQPLPFSNHVVTPVVGWWHQPTPVRPVDAAESSAVFRAPVADLLDPANRVTWTIRQGAETRRGPGWILEVDGAERFIWGFTAGLLDRLLARLGWEEPWDQTREVPLG